MHSIRKTLQSALKALDAVGVDHALISGRPSTRFEKAMTFGEYLDFLDEYCALFEPEQLLQEWEPAEFRDIRL